MIPAALWTELSLMGRWVADSIVLRWAEFTENRAHQTAGVTKQTVLPLLLQTVEADRRVQRAKLPSRGLVEHRRGIIIRSWEHLYEAESALFLHHAADFLGEDLKRFDRQAQAALFFTFKDEIEYTAQNRLVERWDGAV